MEQLKYSSKIKLAPVTAMFIKTCLLIYLLICLVSIESLSSYDVIKKVLEQCEFENNILKCLKVKILKTLDRAVRSRNLSIIDGVSLINNSRHSKSVHIALNLDESKLQKLDSEEVDHLLSDASSRFLESHHLEVNVPRLLEEGRKRKGGGNGALYWALAIKGSFLAIAYQGIATMSGLALVMGKMALLLSAILGLKKLISSGKETTTVEIIKQPKFTEQHTYSSSYEDDSHHHKSDDFGNQLSKRLYKNYF